MSATQTSHILVIDDDATMRALLGGALRGAGFDVRSAENGENALAEVARAAPALILLDVHMPGIDGLEVLKSVRARHSALDVPVIMCTTEESATAVETALEMGANDYLVKPVKSRALIARVQLHLRLAELSTRLAAQEQDAAVAAMVVTYNHEINNPLAVAMVSMDQLRPSLKTQAEIDHLDRTKRALIRIAEIVAATRQLNEGGVRLQKYMGTTKMVALPGSKPGPGTGDLP